MIREKLAENIWRDEYERSKPLVPVSWELLPDWAVDVYLNLSDQQIAIFKEFIKTMELPKSPFNPPRYDIPGLEKTRIETKGYLRGQQDLLKAIIKEMEVDNERETGRESKAGVVLN